MFEGQKKRVQIEYGSGKLTGVTISDGTTERVYDTAAKKVWEQPAGAIALFPMNESYFRTPKHHSYQIIRSPQAPVVWQGRKVYEVVMRQVQKQIPFKKQPIHRFFFDAKTGVPVGDYKVYPGMKRTVTIYYERLSINGAIPPNQFDLPPLGAPGTSAIGSWLKGLGIKP